MRAAVYHRYGSPGVVSVDDAPTPVPRNDEVLVRITRQPWGWWTASPAGLPVLHPVRMGWARMAPPHEDTRHLLSH